MSLTRKFMAGMGLTEEQVNAIIEANEETITGLKAEIEKYKSTSEESEKKLAKVQKELDGIKEETKENEGKNPYKVKYDALKEEFDTYKADINAKATKAAKEEAFKALLKDIGVAEKRIGAVVKVSDVEGVELDEDGNIKDADNLKKSLKEEWSDFIPKEVTTGAATSTPPANGGKSTLTREEIRKETDPIKRQKLMLENPEAVGLA